MGNASKIRMKTLKAFKAWSAALSLTVAIAAGAQTVQASAAPFTAAMQTAAQVRHVPLPLIEAIAYVNCRWEVIPGASASGGVGPMDILPAQMPLAAALSGHSPQAITADYRANLDAGAALLAHLHTSGSDLLSWQPAVISTQGKYVAAEIFDALRSGATRTTNGGETIVLEPQALPLSAPPAAIAPPAALAPSTVDYPGATWVPAAATNFSVADRPLDYPVDMIVIHDIEGSAGSAIQAFQNPARLASAHYVISYSGQVTQMVLEKDIAWHAGNWDYNTRAIGIEHAGFAWTPGLYTTAEYQASAHLAASICSRWGVPMDRSHVIGHYQVPDPLHPGLFGGSDHHTDPGPYWNWTYYMNLAAGYAAALPSPPHMVLTTEAVAGDSSATVTWSPARTCHDPITGYQVVAQPGNIMQTVPASATTVTLTGLQNGVSYTVTVTAINSTGQDTQQSNPVVPGVPCSTAGLAAPALASPQPLSAVIQLTATSTGCADPRYRFLLHKPDGSWTELQPFGAQTFMWNTFGLLAGAYTVRVWANHYTSDYTSAQAYVDLPYTLTGCTTGTLSPGSASFPGGTSVPFRALGSGCPSPEYAYWIRSGTGLWNNVLPYSANASFDWNTAGLPHGAYQLAVWIRQHGSGTPTYEVGAGGTYNVTGCLSAALSPPPGPFVVGSTIGFTADAGGCPGAEYEFWARRAGGSWGVAQIYGPSPSFSWNTTSELPGSYEVAVWIRQHGSAAPTYEAGAGAAYTLTGCTSATLTPPPGAFAAGSTVPFQAGAGGCPTGEYEFWVKPAQGYWKLAQPYGLGSTFGWNTAGLPPGAYAVAVWVREHGTGTPTYEAGAGGTYTLT